MLNDRWSRGASPGCPGVNLKLGVKTYRVRAGSAHYTTALGWSLSVYLLMECAPMATFLFSRLSEIDRESISP